MWKNLKTIVIVSKLCNKYKKMSYFGAEKNKQTNKQIQALNSVTCPITACNSNQSFVASAKQIQEFGFIFGQSVLLTAKVLFPAGHQLWTLNFSCFSYSTQIR